MTSRVLLTGAAALTMLLVSACTTDPTGSTSAPPADAGSASPTTSADSTPSELDRQLIAAAWANDVPLARSLIQRGADVNVKDATVQSAYLVTTSEGFLELLELTLEHGADVRSLDSFRGTGLIRAADRGHADIAGRLIQAGVEVDHVNNLGWTALHEAVILGDGSRRYVDTVRVLIAGGADLRLPSRQDGLTPLQHAENKGYDRIAAELRAALEEDDVSAEHADQVLLAAAARGDATAAALALRSGANLKTVDGRGRTPLILATRADHADVVRLLTYLGASS